MVGLEAWNLFLPSWNSPDCFPNFFFTQVTSAGSWSSLPWRTGLEGTGSPPSLPPSHTTAPTTCLHTWVGQGQFFSWGLAFISGITWTTHA